MDASTPLCSQLLMYGCASGTVKKADNKKWIRLKYSVGGELYRDPEPRGKMDKWVLEQV